MAGFFCVYCGFKANSINTLTSMPCARHPLGQNKGKHVLYEGTEKTRYICKFCGFYANSIQALTSINCHKHPDGANRGRHSPTL